MALRLRRRGISRVRPLAGGFTEWRRRGFPVERRSGGRAAEPGDLAAVAAPAENELSRT